MYYCTLLLIEIADKRSLNSINITEFTASIMGDSSRLWMNLLLFSLQIAVCTAYFAFFILYFQKSFCAYLDSQYMCESRVPAIILSILIVIPPMMIRNMTHMK